ncbi:NAD kinase 2, mitochondrial-like [Octopus vulgaris]|uniref:NAD kinase 2, mitochondrial-like n=2 Tax=Octopus TaxID=6643 RepID=A0AA36B0K9_OCTVU|nr:NAD kinase 2, mitochondrial isoform X1 [Octopus sinensis]CAI9725129.1 NAD kinase 2, mitochondrial-like [Octopus vulgaris]
MTSLMWNCRRLLLFNCLPSLVKHCKKCSRFQKQLVCSFFSGPRLGQTGNSKQTFNPKKAVILSKVTRYEYEKLLFGEGTEEQLIQSLRGKMSDYYGLLQRHNIHQRCVQNITKSLEDLGIETKVVQRFDFDSNLINWADIVISAGGDGTFLSAASKITNRDKAVIGINTDPSRSEGYLCLPKIKTYNLKSMKASFAKLLAGDFRWKWRQRIRISMSGKYMYDDPVELHDQQLHFHEHRFTEHVKENEMFNKNKSLTSKDTTRILPLLALNEVFMGESLSSRVSYYELSIDEAPKIKLKSSGITVCTGTGSSSWHFHINHIPQQSVQEILKLAGKVAKCELNWSSDTVRKVTESFNQSLWFDPEIPKMAYTIRDPVMNSVFQIPNPRGCVHKIKIHSRMWDACLVIDGGSSFTFNDGAEATLEIHEEDALRTVSLD